MSTHTEFWRGVFGESTARVVRIGEAVVAQVLDAKGAWATLPSYSQASHTLLAQSISDFVEREEYERDAMPAAYDQTDGYVEEV